MLLSVIIPLNALVVVADGHGAQFFRAHGEGDALSLRPEQELSPKNLADEGPSGSRPEEQTPRQTDEATFAKQLAEKLYRLRDANKYEHLVLAADPQTLGQIRNSLHKTVESSIVLTIDKELMGHPAADIAKIVRNAAQD